jgi:hypothetical protein
MMVAFFHGYSNVSGSVPRQIIPRLNVEEEETSQPKEGQADLHQRHYTFKHNKKWT